jgi:hypothetical protein
MSNIQPFGTSADAATINGVTTQSLKQIKAFGCTVVSFDVSADWGSQAGSLSLNLIEDQADGDRLSIPVIGSPFIFELRQDDGTSDGEVIFEYVGIVESFGRSASTSSKTYSASIASPLKILDSAKVIMDGYTGLGGAQEGAVDFRSMTNIDFGHNNSLVTVNNSNGAYHWFNVSNLINAFGILENEHALYRVPRNDSSSQLTFPSLLQYGDYGYSSVSEDGMPLANLMWALHMGINHLPKLNPSQFQQTHGGNLLYGRHNYDINGSYEGIPYFYDFDALHFYNQVVGFLGPQYRVAGPFKSINEIITEICNEANLEYMVYIDINENPGFGDSTLREFDDNWSQSSNCSWEGLDERKFTDGGHYGGTIRIKTINKNLFFNPSRPFSNIAYNLLGLEVPDLNQTLFTNAEGVHPGKRPGQPGYGLADNLNTFMDPLDSKGLNSASDGFTDVGTESLASGGHFPNTTGIFDMDAMDNVKVVNSNVSLTAADAVTMKVITGGYQTRLVQVQRNYLRHYWGDITLANAGNDPRIGNTSTDTYGLNETSARKVPVVTQLLDPSDMDDYIFIDMQSIFGDLTIENVLENGVYVASMYEIRIAMSENVGAWKGYIERFKAKKLDSLVGHFAPAKTGTFEPYRNQTSSVNLRNDNGGIGRLGAIIQYFGGGTNIDTVDTRADMVSETVTSKKSKPSMKLYPGGVGQPLEGDGFLALDDPYVTALNKIKTVWMPKMFEKIKEIGDTHYGKSWYVPVPYMKTKVDLDGDNLVGNFKRSWDLTDSAYVEPSLYYAGQIPQSNMFIQDGKVSAFLTYTHNFVFSNTGISTDDQFVTKLANPIDGQTQSINNFSEYSIDKLVVTKYGSKSVIQASPSSVDSDYSFLPYAYDSIYDRSLIPFSDPEDGKTKSYGDQGSTDGAGDAGPKTNADRESTGGSSISSFFSTLATYNPFYTAGKIAEKVAGEAVKAVNFLLSDAPEEGKGPAQSGTTMNSGAYFHGAPVATDPIMFLILNNITALDYKDNGEFCFPYIKVETDRVFLPIFDNANNSAGTKNINMAGMEWGLSPDSAIPSGKGKSITEDEMETLYDPFPPTVCPETISYAQVSNRYVYGPWMTNIGALTFRGKIEYEQDDSLVPENFLIPLNFGQFGDFTMTQISGLTGLDLAAQGRANAIDDFALFAQEQGSITIQGAPAIKRIGDSLYGVQNVTDVKVTVSNASINTSYSFKTISPRFGRNNKDLEKRLTKISNMVKKLKLR